ncbi:hypothetical protein wCauA_05865 [Wolbachia endosymbiont of Carposina sasakii]|nr:hypothetical protein wCauA_05865 [Wolbachia endosymbiont of Carposina sasakii]
MSLISLGYIFTYYFLLISSYSLSHFFSRQALKRESIFFSYKIINETMKAIKIPASRAGMTVGKLRCESTQ